MAHILPQFAMADKRPADMTKASVKAARDECSRVRRLLGLNPDPDAPAFQNVSVADLLRTLPREQRTLRLVAMPFPPNPLPVDDRSLLAVKLDELVTAYGLDAVRLALAHIDAVNQGAL